MSGVWTAIGGIFALIAVAVAVVSIIDIFRSHLSRGRTAAWVIIVLLLPLIGSVLYWTLRTPSRDEVDYHASSESALREAHRSQPFDSTRFEP